MSASAIRLYVDDNGRRHGNKFSRRLARRNGKDFLRQDDERLPVMAVAKVLHSDCYYWLSDYYHRTKHRTRLLVLADDCGNHLHGGLEVDGLLERALDFVAQRHDEPEQFLIDHVPELVQKQMALVFPPDPEPEEDIPF